MSELRPVNKREHRPKKHVQIIISGVAICSQNIMQKPMSGSHLPHILELSLAPGLHLLDFFQVIGIPKLHSNHL
jgi:hypothetical protein